MNYNEIMDVIKSKIETVSEFAYVDFDKDELELGAIDVVEEYGGEDMGSTWYRVFYFRDHDVYIRVDGYYSSYDGVDFYDGWDSCSNVRPKEKTITVYE